jgi:hypothetical protein
MDLRVLTLENMDEVRLQSCFNYNAIAFKPFKLLTKILRQLRKEKDYITLGDVYRLFEQGHSVQGILNKHPTIEMRTVLVGRTFYKVSHPNHFVQNKRPEIKCMVDENIDLPHTVDAGMELFGKTTHPVFEGLMGAKDARLWGNLRARGIHVLITKDRAVKNGNKTKETLDITRCAILAWSRVLKKNGGVVDDEIRRLPVILHVPADARPTQIKNMLRKHATSIREIYEERVSPIISVTKGSAKPGQHFLEILHEGFKNQTRSLRDKRLNAWVSRIDFSGIAEEEAKREINGMKRAIEHEISQELKSFHGVNAKVVQLDNLDKNFDPQKYCYSGPIQKFEKSVERARLASNQNRPIEERLIAYKRNKASSLALS